MDVHCIDCHLPPKRHILNYTVKKSKHGLKDAYGFYFKYSADYDWVIKSSPEIASGFVYKESCLECHTNLFPLTLSDIGSDAHLRYEINSNEKRCITCHISVGHFDPLANFSNIAFCSELVADTIYQESARVESFEQFTETIPGTSISFNMKAVPGGTFIMGSMTGMPFLQADEIPPREAYVDSFWLA